MNSWEIFKWLKNENKNGKLPFKEREIAIKFHQTNNSKDTNKCANSIKILKSKA